MARKSSELGAETAPPTGTATASKTALSAGTAADSAPPTNTGTATGSAASPVVHPPENWSGFRRFIWNFWSNYGRRLEWRENPDPYTTVVSEVMLQQTQVSRVAEKLPAFVARFPNFESLASAAVASLLEEWSGLGYNRRALNLQRAAQAICEQHGGQLPANPELLAQLPGFGPYTSASVAAFAFNMPTLVFDTNIRRVYLHHFTDLGAEAVPDRLLQKLVEESMDRENPRLWYYALMDYGAALAGLLPNPNRRSKAYARQSKFEGSRRQRRGAVLRVLTRAAQSLSTDELARLVEADLGSDIPDNLDELLAALEIEGFLVSEVSEGETLYRVRC